MAKNAEHGSACADNEKTTLKILNYLVNKHFQKTFWKIKTIIFIVCSKVLCKQGNFDVF